MTELRRWLGSRADLLPRGIAGAHLADAEQEVAALSRPPTTGAFDAATRASLDVTRYRLHAGRLWRFPRVRPEEKAWLTDAETAFERMMQRLLHLIPDAVTLPDFDLAVNLGDEPIRGAPVLGSWSRKGYANVRVPGPEHWESHETVPLEDARVRAHLQLDPDAIARRWQDRENRVVWRGPATGMDDGTFPLVGLRRFLGLPVGRGVARIHLCRLSARHPDVLDARITGWPHLSDGVRRLVEVDVPTGPRVDPSWHLGFRWVISVDGTSAPASFLAFLGAGTVVLKQDSPWLDWCAGHLRPGEHYVPFARDLGDLVEVASSVLEGRQDGARIEQSGRRFSERFLTGTSIDYRILAVLDRYAGLAPVAPAPGSDWVPAAA